MKRIWLSLVAFAPAFGALVQCGGTAAIQLLSPEGGDERGDAAGGADVLTSSDATVDRRISSDAKSDGRPLEDAQGEGSPDAVSARDGSEEDGSQGDVIERSDGEGCVPGASCAPSACATGISECDGGQTSCMPTGMSANGSACDAGAVCNNGTCTGCSAGQACGDAGPCEVATIACSTGEPVCALQGNMANGTRCGTNEVCNGGQCVACTAGLACATSNPCASSGVTSCATGDVLCVSTGNVPDGTSCGANELCCDGVCATCSTMANATDRCLGTTCDVTCNGGLLLCNGACVDVTSDNAACGSTCRTCPAGTTCVSSECVIYFGDVTPFSPCNGTQFTAGQLLGQRVAISASFTLTGLGVVAAADEGTEGILAFYSDVGGSPSALVAQTSATPIAAGSNLINVTSPKVVAAGNYWIVGEYSASTPLCEDSASTNMMVYVAAAYPTVPAQFGTSMTITGPDVNYFVAGLE